MNSRTFDAIDFRIEGKGYIPARKLGHARDMLNRIVELVGEPVLSAKVLLADQPHNSVEDRCRAEASLSIRGGWIRAHTSAPTVTEAIDTLHDKLRGQLRHRSKRRRSESIRRQTESGSWHHGDRPSERPPFFDRAVEDRDLVRHKTFTTATSTVDEAFWDMTQLDYDFFLFCDEETGKDAVITAGGNAAESDGAGPVVHRAIDAPVLSIDAAIAQLNADSNAFVFFLDAETQRGAVAYRRYDGNYGLLTPAI